MGKLNDFNLCFITLTKEQQTEVMKDIEKIGFNNYLERLNKLQIILNNFALLPDRGKENNIIIFTGSYAVKKFRTYMPSSKNNEIKAYVMK